MQKTDKIPLFAHLKEILEEFKSGKLDTSSYHTVDFATLSASISGGASGTGSGSGSSTSTSPAPTDGVVVDGTVVEMKCEVDLEEMTLIKDEIALDEFLNYSDPASPAPTDGVIMDGTVVEMTLIKDEIALDGFLNYSDPLSVNAS